ncbi:hypothetical protein [Planctomonas psychrotolerans]|uniref:hypothetical protein n=1 Tax=Planctomonas psychrotolerans TaxID=2528712 RepID=UPI00123C03DD|nr:hypothetical protein [Planctomonas psychrotolerans]
MRTPAFRTVGAASTALAGALLMTGCSALSPVTELAAPVHNALYSTVADADGTLPEWLPEDAEQIRVKSSNSSDATIMTYTSGTPLPEELCAPSEAPPEPPRLRDSWSPTAIPEDALTCSDGWHAVATGNTVFAWSGSAPTSLAR